MRGRIPWLALAANCLVFQPAAGQAVGVSLPLTPADSADLHASARRQQQAFERVRRSNIPTGAADTACDQVVGRVCYRFTGSMNVTEPAPIANGRGELLDSLATIAHAVPGDGWVMGQRVAYYGESGRWTTALDVARDCRLAPAGRWWCSALEGTALQYLARYPEAHEAFDAALAAMPADQRRRWTDLSIVVDDDLRRVFDVEEPDSLAALANRLWTLADPLFLVSGRDRETEHYARWTLAHARADAANAYGTAWRDDLTEVLVRYGPELQYQNQGSASSGSTWGYRDSRAWRTLPTKDQFLAPSAVEPGSWRTDVKTGAGYYAPLGSPVIGGMEVQQARFRRDGNLMVVLGWKTANVEIVDPDLPGSGDLAAALFMVPEPALDTIKSDPEPNGEVIITAPSRTDVALATPSAPLGLGGVAVGLGPPGGYLVSLELLDVVGLQGWRARHGAELSPLSRGVVALSDLLLLEPEAGSVQIGLNPETTETDRLEFHLGRVIHGTTLTGGLVEVGWEIYGLTGTEGALDFRVTARPESEPGFFGRAARVVGLGGSGPEAELSWTEGADLAAARAGEGQTFRRLVLDLSSLPEGPTRLTLALDLPGRTSATASTVFTIDRSGIGGN